MKRNHLLIAGTGRAGTTFLVKYLAACGLETQLARSGSHFFDEFANAGLEDIVLGQPDAPYVCKSPWLFEFVERLLTEDEIVIDAVVIPMRSLVEAASSRVLNEMRARIAYADVPGDCTRWATWAHTAGGVVYSLNPIDQARLLALGFHELLLALVKREIPVLFLDFPRFVADPVYLYETLSPVLGKKVSLEAARAAHVEVADQKKVRVGRELSGDVIEQQQAVQAIEFPGHETLDRIALVRELEGLRLALSASRKQGLVAGAELANACEAVTTLKEELAAAKNELSEIRTVLQSTAAEVADSRLRLDSQSVRILNLEGAELAAVEEGARVRAELNDARTQADWAQRRCRALERSTSWRVTGPMRALSSFVRQQLTR